jgi:hypothetical protein
LKQLSVDRIATGFQVSTSNPMAGIDGRSKLLKRLADVLVEQSEYFEHNGSHRPGNIVGKQLSLFLYPPS